MKRTIITLCITLCLFTTAGQQSGSLEHALIAKFSKTSKADLTWTYHSDSVSIKKLNEYELNKKIPNYEIFKVVLTKYFCFQVFKMNCVILFDSSNSNLIFVEPMWWSDISEPFLKLFIGTKFEDDTRLVSFIKDLQELLDIGSVGKFENTKYSNDNVTFAFVNEQLTHNKEVWRNIEVSLSNNVIQSFKSTNPVGNSTILVK
jgi:hypothetical protein